MIKCYAISIIRDNFNYPYFNKDKAKKVSVVFNIEFFLRLFCLIMLFLLTYSSFTVTVQHEEVLMNSYATVHNKN